MIQIVADVTTTQHSRNGTLRLTAPSVAQDFANAQHIILVDGKRLTELMIEFGLGVSTQSTYRIRRIDSDYFADD